MTILKIPKKTSNKTGYLLKSTEGKGKGTQNPTLVLDKITVLVDIPSSSTAKIANNVEKVLPHHPLFATGAKKWPEKFSVLNGYVLSGVIKVLEGKRRVFLQIVPKSTKLPFLRLDFNPSKIGSAGLKQLHDVLAQFLPGGFSFAIANGRISRIDIAVDFSVESSRLAMDDLIFFPHLGAPFVRQYGKGGHLQTMQLGKPKGNQWKIYRKDKEQLAIKDRIVPATIRIERVLRGQQGMKLISLAAMGNPFTGTSFAEKLPPRPNWEDIDRWTMFSDSVKVRGVTNALLLLPEARRAKYRKYLQLHAASWWEPTEIWKQWSPLISHLGISEKKAFI